MQIPTTLLQQLCGLLTISSAITRSFALPHAYSCTINSFQIVSHHYDKAEERRQAEMRETEQDE